MREDAFQIIQKTIADCLPDKAVRDSLQKLDFTGKVYVVAIGKAAWVMAKTASVFLADRLEKGIIITKYEHSRGALDKFEIIEAGHPTPDENSVLGAGKAVELVKEATQEDTVLLLLSGGGSSLVELPMPGLTLADIQEVTRQLLFCGAGITEINVLRKKLSAMLSLIHIFSREPAAADNPLLKAPNMIITPHIAWAPREARQRLMDITVENMKAYLDGRPIHVVNM